ncbi:MAG: hypothetical protein ACOX4V_01170 [Anaerovoracaceae bacterium]
MLAPNVTAPVNASVVNVGLLLGERMLRVKTEGSPNSITRELDDILGEDTPRHPP